MKKNLLSILTLALLVSCGARPDGEFTVTVKNELGIDRTDEMVEIPMSDITARVMLVEDETYWVVNEKGEQLPQQITFDGKLMFPVSIKAHGTATFKIIPGEAQEIEPMVEGRHYPERVDDIAWENDVTAYRCYGPALQASGEKAYGYDVWVKNKPYPVVSERYANELNPETQQQIADLRKDHRFEEADQLYHSISYHVDHGNGLDCYKVGPTLGGGTAALMDGEEIVYPYCWAKYEIMENGPLRFMVKLTYNPFAYQEDTLVETRIISLAKGSQLNKTTISFSGLSKDAPLAAGIVVHPENTEEYMLNTEKAYMGYRDLTDNIHNDNGDIYVGIVAPWAKETKYQPFGPKEAGIRGASGHLLAIGNLQPESEATYYWGSAWSKAGWQSMDEWEKYLSDYADRLKNPLKVNY